MSNILAYPSGAANPLDDPRQIFEADREELQRFVDVIFQNCVGIDGFVSLRAFEHERGGAAVVNTWTPFDETLGATAAEVAAAVANRPFERRAVFSPPVALFGDQGLAEGKRVASEANIVCAPAIAVELDERPAVSLEVLIGALGHPTLVVASGGQWRDPTDVLELSAAQDKLHAYWRLAVPATNAEDRAALRRARALAARLVAADTTAVPLSHPMRWPGSWHTKGRQARLCRIVGGELSRDVALQEAIPALEVALSEAGLDAGGVAATERGERLGFKTRQEWSASRLQDAARLISNEGLSWDRWNRLGMAFFDASHGSVDGLDSFHEWSGKDDRYDIDKTDARWSHWHRSPPSNLSAGTLLHEIRKVDSTYEARIDVGSVFEHGHDAATTAPGATKTAISATPYCFVDPSTLSRRAWIYGDHFIRKFVSVTAAPSKMGKSSLAIAEALAMASGKPLLGVQPKGMFRVWYWNGEDPFDELQKRVEATRQHYGLTAEDIGDRFFLDSGRQMAIVLAQQTRDGPAVANPVAAEVVDTIRANEIDVSIIDPFVSTHRVSENDNGAIDAVAKTWSRIADATNSAIDLVHHVRKVNDAEVTLEDARGAVSLIAAARSARVLTRMPKEVAIKLGLEASRRSIFRFNEPTSNLAAAPAETQAQWMRLLGVDLANGPGTGAERVVGGDAVGVVTPFTPPALRSDVEADDETRILSAITQGRWRKDPQARDSWVGVPVAQALRVDLDDPAEKTRVKGIISALLKSGRLREVNGKDERRKHGVFVEVAPQMPVEDAAE